MTQRHFKQALLAGVVALALAAPGIAGADNTTNGDSQASTTKPQAMTGKQKATAIGAGTGAVAGAIVGGPVGAVVGAGIGGYVGHEGTDANGKVDGNAKVASAAPRDSQVRKVQRALNERGFNLAVDGVYGPNTERAVRDFQGSTGLAQTGTLDNETLTRLGVTS